MSTAIATISAPPRAITHEQRRCVSQSHKIAEGRLRRRAGTAYARIDGQATTLARLIRRHHTVLTHRKAGKGGLANVLIEVAAWEAGGYDTTPLLEAIIETQLDARGELACCIRSLTEREQELDHAENLAQHAALRREPGGVEMWARSLAAYVAHAKQTLRCIAGGAA